MMKIASGRRVPGGAVDRSTRVERRTTASMPNSISASLASHTAPGRRSHKAIPAATPTLVIARRAPRNSNDSVDREPRFQMIDAACRASVAGFQMVSRRMRMRTHPPAAGPDECAASWCRSFAAFTTVVLKWSRARESEKCDECKQIAARQTAGSPRGIAEGDASGWVLA